MRRLVILGAHSEVGRALAEALEDRDVRAEIVRATTVEHVGPGLALIDERIFDDAALAFLAFDDRVTRGLVEASARLGLLVVDLVGIAPTSAPLVFPALEGDLASALPRSGLLRVPLGLVGPVTAVLQALRPFGPTAARVVTFEGAAGMDRPGIEELSDQTRAIFTGQDVAPRVFSGPVAFGVLPTIADEADPFGPDDAFRADVRCGFDDGLDLRVTRVRVPVFTAEGAAVEVDLTDPPEAEVLVDVLAAGRGLRHAGAAPSTLQAVDRDDALFGRVRVERGRVDVWLAADRLRAGAAAGGALVAETIFAAADD